MYGVQKHRYFNKVQLQPMEEKTKVERKFKPLLVRIGQPRTPTRSEMVPKPVDVLSMTNDNFNPPKISPRKEPPLPAPKDIMFQHVVHQVGQVGWGTSNRKILDICQNQIQALPVEQCEHKNFWEEDKKRLHMYTTGMHATHVDDRMGINMENLEGMSIRHQRQIILQKAPDYNKHYRMRNKYKHRAHTQIKERHATVDMTGISDAINEGKLKASQFESSQYTKRTQDNTTQGITSQGDSTIRRDRPTKLDTSRNQTAEPGTSRMSRQSVGHVGTDSVSKQYKLASQNMSRLERNAQMHLDKLSASLKKTEILDISQVRAASCYGKTYKGSVTIDSPLKVRRGTGYDWITERGFPSDMSPTSV